MKDYDQVKTVQHLLDDPLPDVRASAESRPIEMLVIARDLARDRGDKQRWVVLAQAVLEKIG